MTQSDPRTSPIRPKAPPPPVDPGISTPELVAGALALLWLLFCGIFFLTVPSASEQFDPLTFVMTLLAVFMPIAVIWVAAMSARSARVVREESRRLQAAVDALRQTYLADRHGKSAPGDGPSVIEQKLAEIARAAKASETALAMFASQRGRPTPAPAPSPVADTGSSPHWRCAPRNGLGKGTWWPR